MKMRLLYNLYIYFNIIVFYLFWGYFSVMLVLYILNVKINIILSSIFFLLLGLWLGTCLPVWIKNN
ncbi:hypothetical protein SAMN05444405_106114 [Bacteroides luti]|uniref:Uncharacterized protein n=1 Tax=Bacteroides luti TaxID=1297750 RepID=A0A1M5A0W4_9BACE|nr:hypothetical protein SAMN05444405_106114 [Bacteroides luti]